MSLLTGDVAEKTAEDRCFAPQPTQLPETCTLPLLSGAVHDIRPLRRADRGVPLPRRPARSVCPPGAHVPQAVLRPGAGVIGSRNVDPITGHWDEPVGDIQAHTSGATKAALKTAEDSDKLSAEVERTGDTGKAGANLSAQP